MWAPSIIEETRKVKTNASTVHEQFCFRRCLLLNYSYHSYTVFRVLVQHIFIFPERVMVLLQYHDV